MKELDNFLGRVLNAFPDRTHYPVKGICAQVEIQLYAYAVYKLRPLPFRYTITKVVMSSAL